MLALFSYQLSHVTSSLHSHEGCAIFANGENNVPPAVLRGADGGLEDYDSVGSRESREL
jgi:hypothetical protein